MTAELFDCSECGGTSCVAQTSADEAVCNQCGVVFTIGDDVEDEVVEDLQPESPPPLAATSLAVSPVEVVPPSPATDPDDEYEEADDEPDDLEPSVVPLQDNAKPMPKKPATIDLTKDIQKPPAKKKKKAPSVVGVPDYVTDQRAWKFAHELGGSGNPYRNSSKAWHVYEAFSDPCTLEQAILKLAEAGHNTKISYLATVTMSVMHLLYAGLLVRDADTGVISPCEGLPVPAPNHPWLSKAKN